MGKLKYELELISLTDSVNTTKFRVRISGTREFFFKSLEEVYTPEYLDNMSNENCCYLGYLHGSMNNREPNLPLPEPKNTKSNYISIITVLFTVFLILSNLCGSKISYLFGFNIASGLIFFPVTYIIDDIVTEVYGFKKSRKIIWTAFTASILFVIGLFIVSKLPPSSVWNHQDSFELFLLSSPRIFMASCIAYLTGEFINSIILSKLKIMHDGKYFYIRAITSTLFGVAIENIIFCLVAFIGQYDTKIIIEIILVQFIFKILYEIVMLPVTSRIVGFLKKKEKIDYYDYYTNYNPFNLKDD
jgi:uncharacterized integral membrane protein (TIGR00697 family)